MEYGKIKPAGGREPSHSLNRKTSHIKGEMFMRHISRKIIAMSMGIMMAGSAVCHISVQTSIVAEAHSGRTDASGGHRDNKNKSGLGSYHYHCGGHPAHLHTGGVCPYAAASSGSTQSTTSAPASEADTELTKQVQQALNDKGYDCGTPTA